MEINKQFQKVLVVDDSSIDLMIADQAIKKYNFSQEIILKDSVISAIEYLENNIQNPDQLPQIIFLDINMPELDGFDFLDKFEMLPGIVKENCQIIMLSTSLHPDDHARINNNVYVKHFINKPLSKSKIEEIKFISIVNKIE